MPVAWLASPVAPCALVAAGVSLALYLFCTLKIETRAGDRRPAPSCEPPEIAELRRRLEAVEARWRKSEAEAALAGPPAVTVRPGMNLNRRSQALRLDRRGETPGDIARLLAMPAAEVRLLLKVHQMQAPAAVEGPEREPRLNPGLEPADMANSGVKPSRRSGEPT